MKTKFLIALLALGLLLGCKSEAKYDHPVSDTLPKIDTTGIAPCSPPQYLLALEFVDKVGNNISLLDYDDKQIEVFYTHSGVKLEGEYSYCRVEEDEICYLITTCGGRFEDKDSLTLSLTWKIKSEPLFADQEVHVIQSYWVYNRYYPTICQSFEFEGVTYYPTPKNGLMSTARVVVNR